MRVKIHATRQIRENIYTVEERQSDGLVYVRRSWQESYLGKEITACSTTIMHADNPIQAGKEYIGV